MTAKLLAGLALTTLVATAPAFAQSGDPIQIAGSSTVLPYAQIVAENFGEVYPDFATPVVESGGTGGGFRQFCQGVGPETIDIANASRPISAKEIETCKTAGVTDIQEVRFGYDGIVFASAASGAKFALDPAKVFMALGAKVAKDGNVVDNAAKSWSEIDASLPAQPIAAFIPAENHGTREVFEEKLMAEGCKASGALEAFTKSGMDEKAAKEQCLQVRNDGVATDIAGDYTETLARIQANPQGVGVFGLAFFEQNQDKLQVATVSGVTPSVETVASGEYPVSRPLFFYVKKAHVGTVAGLKEFVEFFLSEEMIGGEGPLAQYGLVPAPDAQREEARTAFEAGTTVKG
ncbi:substrate-binding domain-containing protein [Aurantimonas sp. Leaf443]|uniref:substrate-binding domain-containing protein n=1 Tax=Aurantimonas sp. Leaf443 TaxID=1736378 RepID=UPI0006FAB403|nr:substrate-binding domain-containing protein [Aurantimonas sp. Leaf443]KQT88119.1 phosphonate ABC transporter substrate-binding protein [Aurantimonas sp. Leaf443]